MERADPTVGAGGARTAWGWLSRPPWLVYMLVGGVLLVVLLPFDGAISRGARSVRLGGDVRRELEALQQYGQFTFSILIALAIWLQDPAQRRRLADWGAAFLVTAAFVFAGKGLIGRPRPLYDDPLYFLGPLGQYPVSPEVGVRHAWEFWVGISSRLWSMPSSHTAYAAVMGLFLASLYPRLRFLALGLTAFVGVARVLTGGHYATDVVVGAAIGLAVTHAAVRGRWGQRVLERLRRGDDPGGAGG